MSESRYYILQYNNVIGTGSQGGSGQMAWVYILQSEKNGQFYIGSTTNLKQRYKAHCQGIVKSTRDIRPIKLVFFQGLEDYKTARSIECHLKKFKSRRILKQIVKDGFIKIVGL